MMKKENMQGHQRSKPLKKVNAHQFKQTTKKHYNRQQKSSSRQAEKCTQPYLDRKSFNKHYASTTQLLYSPFQTDMYLPPHLNSSQVIRNVFNAECKNWSIRRTSYKKYDYDQLYEKSERRYEVLSTVTKKSEGKNRKWSNTKSKIKYLLDEDRASYLHFQKKRPLSCAKRIPHPDDDLSEESEQNDKP